MDKEPLSPTNDFVFKKMFSEHTEILADLIKSVLDLPDEEYEGLVVIDPYLRRETIEDKQSILDIKVKTKDGKTLDVEVQVKNQPSIWKRMQYYNGTLYADQIKSGNNYELLTKAISILIANFPMIEEDTEYHHRYRLYDEKNRTAYPDSNEIHVLEVPKVRRDDKAQVNNWLKFFAAKTEGEFMSASTENPTIAKAWGYLKTLSADEETRLIAESREKGRRDIEDRIRGEKLEIARNALREKIPGEVIARMTGLSIGEIERLAKEL